MISKGFPKPVFNTRINMNACLSVFISISERLEEKFDGREHTEGWKNAAWGNLLLHCKIPQRM